MSTTASLDAAALARKERLAQLKSLKRKQPDAPNPPRGEEEEPTEKDVSHLLSGRNYDAESRGPKMGFASAPSEGQTTLEEVAERIAASTLEASRKETAEAPIDLFSLQPKKPNWDLKRDVEKKMEGLNRKTDMAIARLIRARMEEARAKKGEAEDEGEGVEGDLARLVGEREKEGLKGEDDGEVEEDEG